MLFAVWKLGSSIKLAGGTLSCYFAMDPTLISATYAKLEIRWLVVLHS